VTDNRQFGVPGSNICRENRHASIRLLRIICRNIDFVGRPVAWAVNPHENVRRRVYSVYAINRFR